MRKVYLALLALGLQFGAMSQTVSIGTGVFTGGSSPWDPYFGFSYVQTIYLASEINAAGNITSLTFNFAGSFLDHSDSIDVFMGHTTKNVFDTITSWVPATSLTKVYGGKLTNYSVPGLVTITLSTPFAYNGSDNLVIAVDENKPAYDGATRFGTTNVGTKRVMMYRSDVTNPDPLTPPAGQLSLFIGNVTLQFNSQLNNRIVGSVYYDNNKNSVKDAGEALFPSSRIIVGSASDTNYILSGTGQFIAYVDTGSYVTTVTPYQPYYVAVPPSQQSMFTGHYGADTVLFAMQPVPGQRDVAVTLVPASPVRIGRPALYKIVYRNPGTDTIPSGTIELIKDSRLNYNASTPSAVFVSGDTLRWSFSNLMPGNSREIFLNLVVQFMPAVQLGDTLRTSVSISPVTGDLNPKNNGMLLAQRVTGAYDPNDKTESHAGTIKLSEVAAGDYLTYTIRFQNTGNDTAFNVFIRDTLESKLDWNTMEMLTSSADYQMTLNDGKCVWAFNNINLVDSIRNEPLSHGYLVYRIKPKSTVQVGDVVKNRASIYFDFNLPVNTNTETTTVVANALPVRLFSFTAKKDGKVNKLQWNTANEVNVDRFEVQRSQNSRTFNAMDNGQVTMDNGRHEYNYIDYSPLTIHNYYRLKMIDKDGSFTYSSVVKVSSSIAHSPFSISLHPNPVKDVLQVEIVSDKQSTLQAQVIAHDGKMILSQQWHVQEGNAVNTFNTSSLPKGSYFLKVISESKDVSVMKFEKL